MGDSTSVHIGVFKLGSSHSLSQEAGEGIDKLLVVIQFTFSHIGEDDMDEFVIKGVYLATFALCDVFTELVGNPF